MGIEQTLKRAEVFLGLDDSELSNIAALPSCREKDYQSGEIIFRAGDTAKYLYVLKEGQIDLVMKAPSSSKQAPIEVTVDRITTGDFFGWSALVKPHLRTLSAICKEPSSAVAISGSELTALFEKDHRVGYKVFQSLSQIIGTRLRDVEKVMVTGKRWPFPEEQKKMST